VFGKMQKLKRIAIKELEGKLTRAKV